MSRLDKRRPDSKAQYIDYGLSVMRQAALADVPEDHSADLADVFGHLAKRGRLAGSTFDRFYEIGSPAGLEETRKYLSKNAERP